MNMVLNLEYDAKVREISERVMQNERDGLYEGRVEGANEYPPHYKAQYTGAEARIMYALNKIVSDFVVELLTENNIVKPENLLANLKAYAQYCSCYTTIYTNFHVKLRAIFPDFLNMLKEDYLNHTEEKFGTLLFDFLECFYKKNKELLWQA